MKYFMDIESLIFLTEVASSVTVWLSHGNFGVTYGNIEWFITIRHGHSINHL